MAQLILTWSAPSECNGCTFEYRYKLSSASAYVTGATSNTIVTINNLIDAQTYNYSVRTVCPDAGGNLRSRWLNGSSVTCNTNPPLQPTPTPTITPTPTATSTPTPTPTPTATVVVPTATPTPTPTATVSSCITGTASATGNCSGSGLSTFTLLSGYQAVVKPSNSSFFYSGTGTRYAYAYLRTNTGTNIQEFTLTQVNSNSPTFSPTGYTITTPGTYQLYVQQVDCNQGGTGGSGTMTLNVGDCQVSTSPTATPTPTPTPTQAPGQCYTFTVSNTVNQDNYGVRYTDPNVGTSQDVKFNMLPAEDGGSYSIFYICSNVDPTLLDYTGGSPIGVGSISGVSKLGPNGECTSSLDCYPPTAQYCYYDNVQQTTVGPFNTLQECQNAAGSYVCNQCIS